MAQAVGGRSHIGDRDQNGEMLSAVEVVVVVPADMVARFVVEQHRQRALIVDGRRPNAGADKPRYEILEVGAVIEGDDGGGGRDQGFVGDGAALLVRRHEASLWRNQALSFCLKGDKSPSRQQIR